MNQKLQGYASYCTRRMRLPSMLPFTQGDLSILRPGWVKACSNIDPQRPVPPALKFIPFASKFCFNQKCRAQQSLVVSTGLSRAQLSPHLMKYLGIRSGSASAKLAQYAARRTAEESRRPHPPSLKGNRACLTTISYSNPWGQFLL